MTFEERVIINSAHITALSLIVETQLVGDLANHDDPAEIGKQMVIDLLKAEEKVRGKRGESEYALQISDFATSLIDRAVLRALSLRAQEPPS